MATLAFKNKARSLAASVLLLCSAACAASAQAASNELSQYTAAIAHVQPAERLLLLQRFAIHAQPGPLKSAALEFVIWDYLRDGNISHALTWANDLATTDPDNAVAIALLSDDARRRVERENGKPEQLLKMASHGLDMLPQLQRPLGMNGGDFSLLKRKCYAMLSGTAGFAELRMKDFVSARVYLHNAVSVEPNNSQDVYNLALADINGPYRNLKEGYWYLARAVNLTQGTRQGQEIARDARARYVKEGGSTNDWNQFLAAARGPAAGTPNAAVMASIEPPAPALSTTKPAPPSRAAVAHPPALSKPRNSQPAPSVWADDTASTPIVRKRSIPATTGPMSLGILLETSLAHKENRGAVVNSLADMLRRMNDRDEAFILSYDNNVVFQQDLTSDSHQLEEAMDDIKPQKGAVLDDAVAFAAGHLARIAKYPNRVLLVVSDGRNVDSHASPLQTSAMINGAGVRIYCIGVDVTEAGGQARLQALASSTGGESRFISTPGQFRDATRYIAKDMGIDFRY
jgi:hypothetical protein